MVGGWWRLAVGGWWRLVVDGGWWLVAVGGGWRLAVGGWWRLAVGGWWSLGAVLNKKKLGFLRTARAPRLSNSGRINNIIPWGLLHMWHAVSVHSGTKSKAPLHHPGGPCRDNRGLAISYYNMDCHGVIIWGWSPYRILQTSKKIADAKPPPPPPV